MSDTTGMSSFSCGSVGQSYGRHAGFPSPYVDYTSTYVWRTLTELFDWAEFSYLMTPEIREAMRRLVSPFVTPLRIESVDPDDTPISEQEERKMKELFNDELQWPLHAYTTLLNVVFYGNDFISVIAPVERWLKCPDCGMERRMLDMKEEDKFSYGGLKFKVSCPNGACCKNGRRGAPKIHNVRDNRETDPAKFKIKHWPVRQIVLRYYEIPEETEIFWDIPGTIKSAVKRSDLHTLATIDMGMLEAVEKNTLFKFKKDRVFHAKEPSLSALRTNGWGLARVTGLHKQSWLLHLLRKSTQSIALDLDHPIKVVSLAESNGPGRSTGPTVAVPSAEFSRNFNRILASHRTDPTRWHSVASPINAQFLGGEANKLFPVEMFAATKEDLVDAAGMPVELYKGSLTANASPMGLRLFEVQNGGLIAILNSLVQFVTRRITDVANIDPVKVKHEPVRLVDDMQVMSMLAQLASSGQISMFELLRRLGISPRDDMWNQFSEQKMRQEFQTKAQEIVQKQQEAATLYQGLQQGAAPAGGDPAAEGVPTGPPPGSMPSNGFVPPANLVDWESAAMSLAEQLSMLPDSQRNIELKILREQYPTFHAVAIQRLDQVRYQQQVQGRQQMLGV